MRNAASRHAKTSATDYHKLVRLGTCFLLCALTAVCADDRLASGPYVINSAAKSATIGWVVETGCVKTGASADQLACQAPVLQSERVSLSDLKPGETVYYEIPGTAPAAERSGHFEVPPVGRASFHFVVFGDTRTRHDLHRRVIQAISATNPDFVVHTGDLVQNGNNTAQWPVFFDIEKDLLRKTVFYPVLGNHERNNARFHEFFETGTGYYSFSWGSAHFSMIDSDVANVAESSSERERFWTGQRHWLEEDLQKNQKADFRFVVMHHPPITVNHGNEGHVSKDTPLLIPLFEKMKVTAVFAGHDHDYQRHVQNGIQYIVTGGGGAPLAKVEPGLPGVTVKVESTEHYVNVQVDGNKAHIQAVALDGHEIDAVDLNPTPAAGAAGQ